MVWIAENPKVDDVNKLVKPAASCGEVGYLDEIKINLIDPELTKGPTARALLEGKITVLNNVSREKIFTPWQAKAQKYGINASFVAPLFFEEGEVTHAINIYSANVNAYDKQEVEILSRIASNVSLRAKSLRNRSEKIKAIKMLNERVS